jgi:hypothetical protein
VFTPKLTIEQTIIYPAQRSGWQYAQSSLGPLLKPDGILFDTMVERNFARQLESAMADGRVPYRRPWVACVHVPSEYPPRFDDRKRFSRITETAAWRESWPFCRGLFTLSRSMRDWLAARVDVPVVALHHPTEFCNTRFCWDRYLAAGQRVVQVGWWLRRLASIHFLPLPKARKAFLIPQAGAGLSRFGAVLEAERLHAGAPPTPEWNVHWIPYQSTAEYDAILASSVIFLDLYNAVANNAVIEAIVRATPVLVNPLPAVREYLGEDYPLYYETLDEAATKASDPTVVRNAHEYLRAKDMSFLSGETFCRELASSEMYRGL